MEPALTSGRGDAPTEAATLDCKEFLFCAGMFLLQIFFSTQKLYYAFQPNWQYWKKGKKATSSKGWKDTDEDREQYEQMLERVHSMKPKKDKKGGKKKSKGIKRRLRGQAKGYSKGSTKRVPCLPLFSFCFLGVQRDPLRLRSPPSPCPRPRILLARALRGQARACPGPSWIAPASGPKMLGWLCRSPRGRA